MFTATVGAQPLIAFLIVKVPPRTLMAVTVLCWGIATACLGASKSFGALLACRFLLGLFEAACLPLFTMITATWYRRSEQPLRVALWYGTSESTYPSSDPRVYHAESLALDGIATMLGSLLAWALSHIVGAKLASWQILFLIVGLITVVTSPIIWWKIDNLPATARFL
jgi:MFS family permease